MAARRIVMARQPLLLQLKSPDQGFCTITSTRLLVGGIRWSSHRRFGAFNDNVKEEANRMKQTTEKLYKHVDDTGWTESAIKKISSSVREKMYISAAASMNGTLRMENKEIVDESTGTSTIGDTGEETTGKSCETLNESAETLFGKLKAKVSKIMNKGYNVVKDELNDIAKEYDDQLNDDDIDLDFTTKDGIVKDDDDIAKKVELNDVVGKKAGDIANDEWNDC